MVQGLKRNSQSPETTDFEYEIFRVPQILFSALQSLKRNRTGIQIKPASSSVKSQNIFDNTLGKTCDFHVERRSVYT
jgi:hypothetical protein